MGNKIQSPKDTKLKIKDKKNKNYKCRKNTLNMK